MWLKGSTGAWRAGVRLGRDRPVVNEACTAALGFVVLIKARFGMRLHYRMTRNLKNTDKC